MTNVFALCASLTICLTNVIIPGIGPPNATRPQPHPPVFAGRLRATAGGQSLNISTCKSDSSLGFTIYAREL